MKPIAVILSVLLLPCWLQGQTVIFSHPAGCYDDVFNLELSSDSELQAGMAIHYTLNGFDPKATSPAYGSPITLNADCFSPHQLFKVRNCPPNHWNPPDSVEHIIVVRAAIFDPLGQRISEISTASYYIQNLNHRPSNLPILSLCVDSAALLSQVSGIFVPGIYFDTSDSEWTGNYYRTGRNWEKNVHLDYFSPTDDLLSMDCGIRTHGGNSRRMMQKGLSLYAREDYGKKNFNYPFFKNSDFRKYKRLCLKPFSASWTDAGIQDWLSQIMARELRFDYLAVQPVTLYINGEYWGIYILQEKPDEHYVDNHYGYDDDEVDVIGNWFGMVENGSNSNFLQLMSFVAESDLSLDENYQHLCSLIDMPAFIDYQLFEMFIGNYDWPQNNIRCWQYENSPWRWFYYDGDGAMQSYNAMDNLFCVDEGAAWPSNAHATLLFRSLLNNRDFYFNFNSRMNELFGILNTDTISYLIDSTKATLSDEIPYQIARFSYPQSVISWDTSIENIRAYFNGVRQNMCQKLINHEEYNRMGYRNLNIYPNPSKEDITAFFISQQDIRQQALIYDIRGRVVYSQDLFINIGFNAIPFHLNLPNGLYLFRLGNETTKFILLK